MGAATDLETEGTRRLLVNAAYWAIGLEDKIPARSDVALVGEITRSRLASAHSRKGPKFEDHAIR